MCGYVFTLFIALLLSATINYINLKVTFQAPVINLQITHKQQLTNSFDGIFNIF